MANGTRGQIGTKQIRDFTISVNALITALKTSTANTWLLRQTYNLLRLTPSSTNNTPTQGDIWYDSLANINLQEAGYTNTLLKRQGNAGWVGSTVRMISVGTTGDFGATNDVVDGYVNDADVQAAITGATFTNGRASVTPANNKTLYQGQIYAPAGYLYFALQDNVAGRIQLS
ncbi:hypothetical protein [Mucilaginibacter sp. KACC 22063]|uniref:hypothetical protein n=1 Tax=Mucilaginibacter sp. KACC 22063 TaxID=3025666 RepID=UPI002366B82F|nr:hypothetical protein [Mucilaginibacter sp. KACC 22063]WDF54666.1 hypothetical protein PQ461_17170 [Mucilaginibacter sp. KACC 22063]